LYEILLMLKLPVLHRSSIDGKVTNCWKTFHSVFEDKYALHLQQRFEHTRLQMELFDL